MDNPDTDIDDAYTKSLALPIDETKALQDVSNKRGSFMQAVKPGPRPQPAKKGCTTSQKLLTVFVVILAVVLILFLVFYLFDKKRDFFMSYFQGGKKEEATTTPAPRSGHATSQPNGATITGSKYTGMRSSTPVASVTSFMTNLAPNVSQQTVTTHTTNDTAPEGGDKEMTDDNDTMPRDLKVAVQRIRRSIDDNENPCGNFYKFACGGWIKDTQLPEGLTYKFMQTDMETTVVDRIHVLLLAPSQPGELSSITKTKNFYKACIDEETSKKRGDKPIREIMENELGGWPLTTPDWNETEFDLESTMAKLTLLGVTPIVNLHVDNDKKDPDVKRLVVELAPLILPNQLFYLAERTSSTLVFYENFILAVAGEFGISDGNATLKEIKEMVDFEIQLAKAVSLDNEHRLNIQFYNPMTLEDMQGNYSNLLNWKTFVENIMTSPQVMGIVNDTEIIINLSPHYLQNASEVVNKTPKRILANYMLWSVIYTALTKRLIVGDYHELYKQFQEIFGPPEKKVELYGHCVHETEQAMKLTVSRLYVEEHFDPDSKKHAVWMSDNLKSAFGDLLKENNWMDKKTNDYAVTKLAGLVSKIGYPDEIYNNTFLDDYYKDLTIRNDSHFENVIDVMKFVAGKQFRELRIPNNPTEWEIPSTEINAFYHPIHNQIISPAGILQPTLFSKDYPKSINFGSIGHVLGHEMTHAFDADGRNYERYGLARNWWTPDAEANFLKASKCMIDQYSSYMVPQVNQTVDGKLTLNENIADNGGIKVAFRAYKKWIKLEEKREDTIPGLNFTHDQLFFISQAQMYCAKRSDDDAKKQITADKQSPEEFRIIGALQNSKDFATTFSCPEGSNMNPTKKCQVW